MPSDDLQELLSKDFDALASKLEKDRFSERTLFKLNSRSRARQGVVFFAGGLGAAFAASQFSGVVGALSVYMTETSLGENAANSDVIQIAATLLLAGALAATALVVRQES